MNRPETARISPIPIIHKRSQSNISSSGGYYQTTNNNNNNNSSSSSSLSLTNNKKSITKYHLNNNNELPENLLLIDPRDKYIVKEGFGITAPTRKIVNIPPLVAHNALFVKPPEPEPIPVEEREIQTEQPVLFKREMDSLHDYQEWITQNIDPLLKDLRMSLIQSKPEDIGEYLLAYANAIITKTDFPRTVDKEEYFNNLNHK